VYEALGHLSTENLIFSTAKHSHTAVKLIQPSIHIIGAW